MNQFGDLTVDEYRYFFLGLRSDFSNGTKGQLSSLPVESLYQTQSTGELRDTSLL